MNKEDKKSLRLKWLSLLSDFSSLENQKKEWLSSKSPSSYTELMCQYFDDLLTEDTYSTLLNEKIVTEKEIEITKPFHNALLKYNEPSELDVDIINDHKWIHISKLALECIKNLQELLTDSDELNSIKKV